METMGPVEVAGDGPPRPAPPRRRLDLVTAEDLHEFVDDTCPDRHRLKSRDFPEMIAVGLNSSEVEVVLYDMFSPDSFAGCYAAYKRLGNNAQYVGVHRNNALEDLQVDVSVMGKVVAMVGVCWSSVALHDLFSEAKCLIILETHDSVSRDLAEFNYPSAVRILVTEMSAGTLAWNFFFSGEPVPPLLRAIEDMELGRHALINSPDFARGFETAFDYEGQCGEVEQARFDEFDALLESRGRDLIGRAIEAGRQQGDDIEKVCQDICVNNTVRTMRDFAGFKCALVEVPPEGQGRESFVAQRLAEQLVAECKQVEEQRGERQDEEGAKFSAAYRCFGAAYVVKKDISRVKVYLRSVAGGVDVSQIAAMQEGAVGRKNQAFFTLSFREWEELWMLPERVLWRVPPSAEHPQCLGLNHGDYVTIMDRMQRFDACPADAWSWGYKVTEPAVEGWIPTLAHTLFAATRNTPGIPPQIGELREGDLIVAQAQQGDYVWGRPADKLDGPGMWYKRTDDTMLPVRGANVDQWI